MAMRVNFYTAGEDGKDTLYGAIFVREGELRTNPPDDPLLLKISSEPIVVNGVTIEPSDHYEFLVHLRDIYTKPEFLAWHMFDDWEGIDDPDYGPEDISLLEFPPMGGYQEYVEASEDDSTSEEVEDEGPLPPAPDWQRNPHKRKRRDPKQSKLFRDI